MIQLLQTRIILSVVVVFAAGIHSGNAQAKGKQFGASCHGTNKVGGMSQNTLFCVAGQNLLCTKVSGSKKCGCAPGFQDTNGDASDGCEASKPPTTEAPTTTGAPTTTEAITTTTVVTKNIQSEENVTVVSRTCISELDVPDFTLPSGVCKATNDSCKHEVVKLSDGTEIMCDTETDGGGWISIQRRPGKSSVFPGNWKDFVAGFGDIRGSFWFGLGKIHQLCPPKRPCELRVDVVAANGQEAFATYDVFSLTGGFDNYKIAIRNFTGQGDIMGPADGAPFTSRNGPSKNDLTKCLGKGDGWWHQADCNKTKTLNGAMEMDYTEMKIRRN